jgi:hypothetical protein
MADRLRWCSGLSYLAITSIMPGFFLLWKGRSPSQRPDPELFPYLIRRCIQARLFLPLILVEQKSLDLLETGDSSGLQVQVFLGGGTWGGAAFASRRYPSLTPFLFQIQRLPAIPACHRGIRSQRLGNGKGGLSASP